MQRDLPVKQLLIAFALALLLYIPAYTWIEYRRTRLGPWQTYFIAVAGQPPTLTINQPRLGIADVRLTFPGRSVPDTNVVLLFRQPRAWPFDVPFGNCLGEDLTFQPGTVVFNLFGHEVQLVPRVLTVDRREYPWQSGLTLAVTNAPILDQPQPSPPSPPQSPP